MNEHREFLDIVLDELLRSGRMNATIYGVWEDLLGIIDRHVAAGLVDSIEVTTHFADVLARAYGEVDDARMYRLDLELKQVEDFGQWAALIDDALEIDRRDDWGGDFERGTERDMVGL